jgi:hypothetical protein
MPAGEADDEGNFPETTIYGLVQSKLKEYAQQRAAFVNRGGEA